MQSAGSTYADGDKLPWLLAAKVQPPDLMQSYTRRIDLIERIEPLRPLTVLRAPAGFGKTSLLADVYHRARQAGRLAAWLTIDQEDGPGILDAYLAFAFTQAGLALDLTQEIAYDSAAGEPTRRRTKYLSAAIGAAGRPCLLVLDDAEKIVHSEAVQSINFLLQHAPPNLCIALGLRENPGLDIAGTVLAGNGVYLTVDQLRFGKPDIGRFFGGTLSRRELNELEERSEGWPVVLRAYRNMKLDKGSRRRAMQDLAHGTGMAAEWLSERLLQRLAPEDRRLLLDVALFEYIKPELANEMLGIGNVRARMERLVVLDGLLRVDDAGGLRLHPMLREYCAALYQRESPQRFARMHGRIARAEAQQGHVVQALRHAKEAGDNTLLGELVEQAGGARIWARLGAKGIAAVESFLNAEVIEAFPRAGLVRVVLLGQTSRVAEGLALYGRLAAATKGFTKDRPGGNDRALREDDLLIQAAMSGFSCRPLDAPEVQAMLASSERTAANEDTDPIVKGALNLLLGIVDQMRGAFDGAWRRGGRSVDSFEQAGAVYGCMFTRLHLGSVAFAQGRLDEALDCYASARPTTVAEVMATEVRHERSVYGPQYASPDLLTIANLGWFDVYAAAYSLTAEQAFETNGPRAALLAVEDAKVRSRAKGLLGVERYLDALQVYWLLRDGRIGAAEQAWRDFELPTDSETLLDLELAGWRRVEVSACARIHLQLAREEFDAAAALAQSLCAVAEEHGLRRMLMNGVALAMAAAALAGRGDEAASQMARFLDLADEVDIVRPLTQVREQALAVLAQLVDKTAGARRTTVVQLLAKLGIEEEAEPPPYTQRELEVVLGVEQGLRNKEIADRLGITEHGVRYHLKNLYSKTNAKGRSDVVRRVREQETAMRAAGDENAK